MEFGPALIISKDGTLGFRVQQDGQIQTLGIGEVIQVVFLNEDHPRRPGCAVSVIFAHGLTRTGVVESLGLPKNDQICRRALIESALGDYLDRNGSPFGKQESAPGWLYS